MNILFIKQHTGIHKDLIYIEMICRAVSDSPTIVMTS